MKAQTKIYYLYPKNYIGEGTTNPRWDLMLFEVMEGIFIEGDPLFYDKIRVLPKGGTETISVLSHLWKYKEKDANNLMKEQNNKNIQNLFRLLGDYGNRISVLEDKFNKLKSI